MEEKHESLRPKNFAGYRGQTKLKERLQLSVKAALQRKEPLEHILLCGPAGLGKTTLGQIIANEMGCKLHSSSGPVLEKAGDLAGLLTSLEEGDVLFIDEMHRLDNRLEEYLYPAMEDFRLDIIIEQGNKGQSMSIKLPKFTLIGATTKSVMISSPLRSRFGTVARLDYYQTEELMEIILTNAEILQVDLKEIAAKEIAVRSRGTPRIANNILKWTRDFAEIKFPKKEVNKDIVLKALEMLEVDEQGLDEMDKKIISVMSENFGGGPVGISSIATAVMEEANTIEEVHEPFLIMLGLIKRTQIGRVLTDKGKRKAEEIKNK